MAPRDFQNPGEFYSPWLDLDESARNVALETSAQSGMTHDVVAENLGIDAEPLLALTVFGFLSMMVTRGACPVCVAEMCAQAIADGIRENTADQQFEEAMSDFGRLDDEQQEAA